MVPIRPMSPTMGMPVISSCARTNVTAASTYSCSSNGSYHVARRCPSGGLPSGQVRRRCLVAVAGDPDGPDQALVSGFDSGFEGAALPGRAVEVVEVVYGVELY